MSDQHDVRPATGRSESPAASIITFIVLVICVVAALAGYEFFRSFHLSLVGY